MIAYSDSDAMTGGSIFAYSDPDNGTATAIQGEWIYYNPKKLRENDPWAAVDYKERKAYLKSLWFAVLKIRQIGSGVCLACRLCCRRHMLSFSGWLARAGYRKKKN